MTITPTLQANAYGIMWWQGLSYCFMARCGLYLWPKDIKYCISLEDYVLDGDKVSRGEILVEKNIPETGTTHIYHQKEGLQYINYI